MVTELPVSDRDDTARLILNLGLAAAIVPMAIVFGALLLMQMGAIDWWAAYGVVIIGDGRTLPLALQAWLAALAASAAGVGAALWAGPQRFYGRAMLNLAITAASLLVLLAIAA
jgi:hypothetical protein